MERQAIHLRYNKLQYKALEIYVYQNMQIKNICIFYGMIESCDMSIKYAK